MKKITGLFGLLAFLVSFGAMAAQNPIVIPNTGTLSGLSLVNKTNDALATLNTGWSGSSAPSTPATGQTWLDTSAVGIIAVKRYDGTQWVVEQTIDSTNHVLFNPIGGGSATLASASTTDIGSKTEALISITGTTTISSFGSSLGTGQSKVLVFSGALTLTYNATSMILPGAANITTAAGDTAVVASLGSSNYRVLSYVRANGQQVSSTVQAANGTNSAPSITFASDTDTGIYHSGPNVFDVTAGGNRAFTSVFGNTYFYGTSSAAATLSLYEQTTNGTNLANIKAPASLATNVDITLPSSSGTLALTGNNLGTESTFTPTIGASTQWTGGEGFLSITISATSNTGTVTKYELRCGAANPPTIGFDAGYFYGHSNANWANGEAFGLNCPIKNNDYYYVVVTTYAGSLPSTTVTGAFRPLN